VNKLLPFAFLAALLCRVAVFFALPSFAAVRRDGR
jgi:hypothetical protein